MTPSARSPQAVSGTGVALGATETTLGRLATDLAGHATQKPTSTIPFSAPTPSRGLVTSSSSLVRLFPGDGSGLGCTGSASSTWGPGALGDQDLRCQQAQSLPPWEWCPAQGQPARWLVMFSQSPDAFCCPASQEVSRKRAGRPSISIQGP